MARAAIDTHRARQGGQLQRALHLVAAHTVSGSILVPAGAHLYRVSRSTRVGYSSSISSDRPFELGTEQVLGNHPSVAQLAQHEAQLPAVAAGQGVVAYRVDFTLQSDAVLGAVLDVNEQELQRRCAA